MLKDDTLIKVLNRDNGTVGYIIPDLGNLYRLFQPKEEKDLPFIELKKLSYAPGGKYILKNCLIIKDKEALEELLPEVEPEYFYDENDVKNLLINGSLDQLMDCLDFAPNGVIDLVKDFSVKLKINDIRKRDAIFNKTGFNVSKAIEINEISKEEKEDPEIKKRRSTPINNEESQPRRRVAPAPYKVVKTNK